MKNNQLEINNRNIWKVWEKFYEDYPEEKNVPNLNSDLSMMIMNTVFLEQEMKL